MSDGWVYAFGEGWAIKVLAGFGVMAGAALGYLAKRPMEKSGMMAVIDAAVMKQFERFEKEIVRCEHDREHDREVIETLAGRVDQLEGEVRQYQQLEQSRARQ